MRALTYLLTYVRRCLLTSILRQNKLIGKGATQALLDFDLCYNITKL